MRGRVIALALYLPLAAFGLLVNPSAAQKKSAERPPHGQDKLPGPALSPQEAISKMKVPPGFSVELVVAEPDLVNPVAMTFDEKGRVWITESLEYPKRAAGVGKDRVKVIDIGPDGKASRVRIFADGLNIPSGIAVGHGGVWVANAPDILFYKTDANGNAVGKPEVVVTGFGRLDTHELPNSLTWGPDGWLYGWNGVFNPSVVKQNGKEWRFTCAIFRIHPRTREFQLFCEGTSNPWGIAIDPEGSLFASACVIDHLWHLTETGYYQRQGGPYPPHTWVLGSIVKHRHQKAAYCGIHYFDSDAYPEEYRGKLYMGNIHGGCINVDVLKREGSSYFATSAPDFLTANDQWFMPVAQRTGPDGSLYVLDWYDRYHCYQDANRDPGGIDRKNGRLYRVRYKDTPRAGEFDLSKESDDKLLERLASPNVYYRDLAQRLLTERANPELRGKLETLVLDDKVSRKGRLHALWAMVGGGAMDGKFHRALLQHPDPTFRAWAIRAAGNQREVPVEFLNAITTHLEKTESAPDVLLQGAIAGPKLRPAQVAVIAELNARRGVGTLFTVLHKSGDDKLIPGIVWQNLKPFLTNHPQVTLTALTQRPETKNLGKVLPRMVEVLLSNKGTPADAIADLYGLARRGKNANPGTAQQVLQALAGKFQTGEATPEVLTSLKSKLGGPLALELAEKQSPVRFEAALLLTAFQDAAGSAEMRRVLADARESESRRLQALDALTGIKDADTLTSAARILDERDRNAKFRGQVLTALGRLEDPKVASVVLERYRTLGPEVQPRVVELLTQRPVWGKSLMQAVAAGKLPATVLNVNQAQRLLGSKDAELVKLVEKHYGTIRSDRNPEREKVVTDIRKLLEKTKGDPWEGVKVYKNLCGQCHKIHGEGVEVGPDITSNGRASFEQLLSNVFDPSLVIGPGYQGVNVVTKRGRQITGLLAEDSAERVVLKVQGGKVETVARKDVEMLEIGKLSLMPEGVEKQLKAQEIADLFAFLCLDKHPDDKTALRIPGTPKGLFGGR